MDYGLDGLRRYELAGNCLRWTGLLASRSSMVFRLFSSIWRSAVQERGAKLGQPGQSGMGTKLIITLICNLIAAVVIARIIHQVGHHTDLLRAVKIGAGV